MLKRFIYIYRTKEKPIILLEKNKTTCRKQIKNIYITEYTHCIKLKLSPSRTLPERGKKVTFFIYIKKNEHSEPLVDIAKILSALKKCTKTFKYKNKSNYI